MGVRSASERSDLYSKKRLAPEVAGARNWTDLMRRLGLSPSGGQRRLLQEHVTRHQLDASHFAKRSPWRKYPDDAIAQAAASSSSLREVALKLGAAPATGTLSHIRRRIDAAGIDISHFPGIDRPESGLPFTPEELRAAAASATSVRGVARALGVPDDSRSRATLSRVLATQSIDISHFSYQRAAIPEDKLRSLVRTSTSYAEVMRGLGMDVNDTNHRRVRRATSRLNLDTSHFKRRPWGRGRSARRPHRPRIGYWSSCRSKLDGRTGPAFTRPWPEIGVPYACAECGNTGEWRGHSITLQIDHVNGNWRDNRPGNLRYLCPNCHALTETWCRRKGRVPLAG